jgi:hypothetical protein
MENTDHLYVTSYAKLKKEKKERVLATFSNN